MSQSGAGPSRILYGRRRGKKLRPARQALIEKLLPELRIELPASGRLEPATLFAAPPEAVWLEIGFGGGEHLAWQAKANPEAGLIGCEPFVNGLASLLAQVSAQALANVRVFDDDARKLLDVLAEASIARLFVLFPDPWPKARHHKRRIIGRETLDACARVLADGAELRLATDDMSYCRWMLERLVGHGAFDWLARGPADWRERPDDWPQTRYEAKARKQGARPVFLRYRRVARG